MLDVIKILGVGGMLGALIGIGLVIWIDPMTVGGTALIIAISTVAVALLSQAVRAMVLLGTNTEAEPNAALRYADPPSGEDRKRPGATTKTRRVARRRRRA